METLKQMRLDEAQCKRVYDVMVREALEQGLTMWKTRNVCLQGATDRENEGRRRNEGADGRGTERARASQVKDPWRSRTSGEMRAERREGEARVEVKKERDDNMEVRG